MLKWKKSARGKAKNYSKTGAPTPTADDFQNSKFNPLFDFQQPETPAHGNDQPPIDINQPDTDDQKSKFEPLFDYLLPEVQQKIIEELEKEKAASPGAGIGGIAIKRKRAENKFEPTGFGLLYSGFILESGKNICPVGFHIPTYSDLSSINIKLLKSKNADLFDPPNNDAIENNIHYAASGLIGLTDNPREYKITLAILGQKNNANINAVSVKAVQSNGSTTISQFTPIQMGNSICAIMDNPANWYEGMTVKDIDGNIYGTSKIGDYVVLTSNLAVTRFNDGTPLLKINNTSEWAAATDYTTGRKPCYWYPNGDINNVGKTSQLY